MALTLRVRRLRRHGQVGVYARLVVEGRGLSRAREEGQPAGHDGFGILHEPETEAIYGSPVSPDLIVL